MERAVADQIIEYMTTHNLMMPTQHGATKDPSPTTGIAAIHDFLLQAAESRHFTSILLIDLTAAYYLKDHKILDLSWKHMVLDKK